MHPSIDQAILQDRKIACAVTDRDLIVIEVNGTPSILQNWGQDWLGRPLAELVPELMGSEQALADILDGSLPRLEIPWVNREPQPGGGITYLTLVDLPHRDAAGQIRGLVHIMQDVTDISCLEQQLMQQRNELRLLQDELMRQNIQLAAANTELHRLDDVKSAFVSVAAHELRTPLTSIIGYLELLLDGDAGALNPKQAEYLGIVDASSTRLLNITNDLLDVTRIEAGRLELVLKTTDLIALTRRVTIEQSPQLEAKAQRLILRPPSYLPRALCDPLRVTQVLSNLISNASKYSPAGSLITVSLALADEAGYLQVTVADQGVGIPADDAPKIFEPFFRASTAALANVSGAGLGLPIARALVELHGGRIWFESAPGEGATFHFTLPLVEPRSSAAADSTLGAPAPTPHA